MPQSNLRQAYYPDGAEMIPNPRGTAPGLMLEHEGKLIFCVPGVPAEMEHLMLAEVVPRLVAASGNQQVIASRVIRTWGRPESEVAELLDDLYSSSVNPSLAFPRLEFGDQDSGHGQGGRRRPRHGFSSSRWRRRCVSRLGETVFGSDDETIERILLRLLSDRGYTIGTAESMTGGMVSARLTELPGSSAVVKGGLVAYDSELKQRLLGLADVTEVVTTDDGPRHGARGEEFARCRCRDRSDRLGRSRAAGEAGRVP